MLTPIPSSYTVFANTQDFENTPTGRRLKFFKTPEFENTPTGKVDDETPFPKQLAVPAFKAALDCLKKSEFENMIDHGERAQKEGVSIALYILGKLCEKNGNTSEALECYISASRYTEYPREAALAKLRYEFQEPDLCEICDHDDRAEPFFDIITGPRRQGEQISDSQLKFLRLELVEMFLEKRSYFFDRTVQIKYLLTNDNSIDLTKIPEQYPLTKEFVLNKLL